MSDQEEHEVVLDYVNDMLDHIGERRNLTEKDKDLICAVACELIDQGIDPDIALLNAADVLQDHVASSAARDDEGRDGVRQDWDADRYRASGYDPQNMTWQQQLQAQRQPRESVTEDGDGNIITRSAQEQANLMARNRLNTVSRLRERPEVPVREEDPGWFQRAMGEIDEKQSGYSEAREEAGDRLWQSKYEDGEWRL